MSDDQPQGNGRLRALMLAQSSKSKSNFYAALASSPKTQVMPFRSAAIGGELPAKTKIPRASIPNPVGVKVALKRAPMAESAAVVKKSSSAILPVKAHASALMPARQAGPAAPLDPAQQRVLKSLGLANVGHALLCVPTSYIDCRFPVAVVNDIAKDARGLFWLRKTGAIEAIDQHKKVVSCGHYDSMFDAPYQGYWSRVRKLDVELEDVEGNRVWISYFNPWKARGEARTGPLLVEGEVKVFGRRKYLTSVVLPPPETSGRVWVRYVCPGAPSEAAVLGLVDAARSNSTNLGACAHAVISASLLSERQLLDIAMAASGQTYPSLPDFFRCLHEPQTPESGVSAAFAARAMGVAGICSAAKAANTRFPHAKAPLHLQDDEIERLIASQVETLTVDQVSAIGGLVEALKAPQPLNGLLSGDVGTGKTLVFLIPAVAAHLSGAQVAIVSPTEILANQVYKNICHRFPQARVERVVAGGKILDSSAILVGTSGLGSVAKKASWIPNFLIIDEQHKLSTKDRSSMVGPWTHQLEASATPIPRSLAATLFSGTQVFELHQAPVKRAITSFVLDESERAQAVSWMRKSFEEGHRIAVIYPKVAASAAEDTKLVRSVLDAAESLQIRFPGKVVMLHGKLSSEELQKNLEDYRSGACPIVVASTIMETGIDIPDIRLMIVKNADNFGTAQLHQLRGRLARNGGAAKFVMMVDSTDALQDDTHERLKTVEKVSDGYALAEADMTNRGFGDLAGLAQSGNTASIFKLLRLDLTDFSAT